MHQYRIREIGIGRETPTEHAASFMGEKYCNQSKTQEQLDQEKVGIDYVIQELKKTGRGYVIRINYIFSPNDTAETLTQTLDEMDHYVGIANDKVHIEIVFNLLTLFPGTAISLRHTDIIRGGSYAPSNPFDQWDLERIKELYPDSVFPDLAKDIFFSYEFNSPKYNPIIGKRIRTLIG